MILLELFIVAALRQCHEDLHAKEYGFFPDGDWSEMRYNMEVKDTASGTMLPGPVAPFRHCVFLDTLLDHFLPWFPHLRGNAESIHIIVWLGGCNELNYVKHLELCF